MVLIFENSLYLIHVFGWAIFFVQVAFEVAPRLSYSSLQAEYSRALTETPPVGSPTSVRCHDIRYKCHQVSDPRLPVRKSTREDIFETTSAAFTRIGTKVDDQVKKEEGVYQALDD